MSDPPSKRSKVSYLREIFDLESSGRVTFYSAIIGIVAGVGAAVFFWGLIWVKEIAFSQVELLPVEGEVMTMIPSLPTNWWWFLLIPTVGGLLCGLLVFTFAPEAEGHGTDALIKAFHQRKGLIRARIPVVKSIASILTIGTGGSAGREGPIAQIGAGFGSFLSEKMKLSDHERRTLILAGAAGGVGAMFQAPLGGALFAVEVLYASTAIEFAALVPCVVSSVVAYSTFATVFGPEHAIIAPQQLCFEGPAELPFFLIFAVLCAAVGYIYVRFFYGLRDKLFHRLPMPNYLKPALGGLMLGGILLLFPQVMGGGYEWIQGAIDNSLPLQLMAVLIVAKIVATSVTISSGGSGGVFAPSLFIGAMLGGAFGILSEQFCENVLGYPGLAPEPEAFVLVGMGGFFAGIAKVPLTSLIIVSEMSGSYNLLVPLMLVSVIHVAVLSSKWSLYEEQVHSLVDSSAHLGDFVVDILEDIPVKQVYKPMRKPLLIREDTPLPKVLRIVAHSNDSFYPVVDKDDLLVGMLSIADLRSSLLGDGVAGNLIVAADVAFTLDATITPDDNLHTVLRYCTRDRVSEIPVVEKENPRKVICMLRRQEVLSAYDEQMSTLRGNHPTRSSPMAEKADPE